MISYVVTSFKNSCLIGQWMRGIEYGPTPNGLIRHTHTHRQTVLIAPTSALLNPFSQWRLNFSAKYPYFSVSLFHSTKLWTNGLSSQPTTSLFITPSVFFFGVWLTAQAVHPGRSSPRRISQRDLTSMSCWNMPRLRWEVETCAWQSCCLRVKT